MKRSRGLFGSERGAALIETAVTMPLLLLVCTGIIEFGRAYQTWQVLTNAAREGARVAVLPGSTDTAVQTRVKNYLKAGQLTVNDQELDIDITRNTTVSLGGSQSASATRVQVNYPFAFMVLQPVARLVVHNSTVGAPLTMSAAATMRNE